MFNSTHPSYPAHIFMYSVYCEVVLFLKRTLWSCSYILMIVDFFFFFFFSSSRDVFDFDCNRYQGLLHVCLDLWPLTLTFFVAWLLLVLTHCVISICHWTASRVSSRQLIWRETCLAVGPWIISLSPLEKEKQNTWVPWKMKKQTLTCQRWGWEKKKPQQVTPARPCDSHTSRRRLVLPSSRPLLRRLPAPLGSADRRVCQGRISLESARRRHGKLIEGKDSLWQGRDELKPHVRLTKSIPIIVGISRELYA